MNYHRAERALVTVELARGFVVQAAHDRLIVTAGHCLPRIPPCASISYAEDRTYKDILGSFGEKPTVWAECLFADPVSDLAVLGSPDDQELPDKAEAYRMLTAAAEPLSIVGPAEEDCPAWILSLDQVWFRCVVRHNGGGLWISDAADAIVGGMSGSPILNDDGSAIGVVCTPEGPNPQLIKHLPGWFLQD